MSNPTLRSACLAAAAALCAACGEPPPPAVAQSEAPPPAPAPPPPPAAKSAEPQASASAAPAPMPPANPGPCGPGMAHIAGGKYEMKLRKGEVEVKPFCLDKLETTAAEYLQCVDGGKCTRAFLDACDGATVSLEGKRDHPIVCVDFEQASGYCAFRGKRLPTDEEWEWAARGRDKGFEFPWGNEPPKDQLCWGGAGPRAGTCPVGAYPKGNSPDGVSDLSGNVLEWTTTPHDAKVAERSARGGSWKDGARAMVRTARPGWFKPSYRCGFLGIRCVTPPK